MTRQAHTWQPSRMQRTYWIWNTFVPRQRDLAYTTDPRTALQLFAYDVVEAASVEDQNEILGQLLVRMTSGHSKETNREVLQYLANKFHTDVRLIAEFAKQEGILV